MQCVIETSTYLRAAKEVGLSDDECHRIVRFVSDNADAGVIIKGTGGARKLRLPIRNKGKSGGVRVITFFVGEDIPVFLLDVFDKGSRIDLSQAERNELKAILNDMADGYREQMKKRVAGLMENYG